MVLLDWYDQAECHQQGAAVDRRNGRIFKVVYGGARPVPVNLAGESDAALVDLLGHDNDWLVRHARRPGSGAGKSSRPII